MYPIKLKWSKRIFASKYFVVLTDRESVICLDGVNPDSMHDMIALQSQAAAISDFIDRLKDLKKEHTDAMEKLMSRKANANTTTRRKTTIKVKEERSR